MAFNNSNIKFLQGSHDALMNLKNSQLGAFYVTNDTHEMFLGVDASKPPVALNRWVDVRDTWADIQQIKDYRSHPGKIYYAIDKNILCTWNATKQQWVQINPDTNTDTSLESFIISDGVSDNTNKTVTYTLSFTQKDINGDTITDTKGDPITISANLVITDELVTSLIVDIEVGLTAAVTTKDQKKVATINTTGEGSDTTKTVTISSEKGITIEAGTTNEIIISGTEYELKADGAAVVLQGNGDNAGVVGFDGDTWIDVANANIKEVVDGKEVVTANKLKVSHKAPTSGSNIVLSSDTPSTEEIDTSAREFTAITNIQADANGHVTGAKTTTFTIPNTVYTLDSTEDTVTVVNQGNQSRSADYTKTISLYDGDSNSVSDIEIKTAHTITVDGTKLIKENGSDLGSFYSAAEIDRQFRVLDALTYKGIVDGDDATDPEVEHPLPTTNVSLGDTYKVNVAFGNYLVGDLLIANGTAEGDNGYITGEITWDHISTGSDADTTYKLIVEGNAIKLQNLVTTNNDSTIDVIDDEYITATVTSTATGGQLNINHNPVTKNDTTPNGGTLQYAGTLAAVTNVTRDDAGHVLGIATTNFTLPGDDYVVVQESNNSFIIKDAKDDVKGSISVQAAAGGKMKVTSVTDAQAATDTTEAVEGKNINISIAHDKIKTTTTPDATKDVTAKLTGTNNTFTVVDSLIDDEFGHITGVKTKIVTIDKETTYTLDGPTKAQNANEILYSLIDSNTDNCGDIKLTSQTLTYKVNNDATQIDLLWGSF